MIAVVCDEDPSGIHFDRVGCCQGSVRLSSGVDRPRGEVGLSNRDRGCSILRSRSWEDQDPVIAGICNQQPPLVKLYPSRIAEGFWRGPSGDGRTA